jgi:hypothetical protein
MHAYPSIKPPTQQRVSATATGATVVAPTSLAPFHVKVVAIAATDAIVLLSTVQSGRPAGDIISVHVLFPQSTSAH